MQLSYWEQTTFFENIDVLVVGSGIVGLTTAIELKTKSPKLKVVVLERGSLPSGASTKNAGFACFGSISELTEDLGQLGLDNLLNLVERRWKGLLQLRKIIGDQALGFKSLGGYELFLKNEDFEKYADKLSFFNQHLKPIIGQQDIFSVSNDKIKTFGFQKVNQLIFNGAEGQIHTGQMMKALLKIANEKGIDIINGVTVKEIQEENQQVIIETTNDWRLSTKKVVVAVNGFAKRLFPELKTSPARNQVLITKPIKKLPFEGTFHYNSGYYYFRNINNRILFGGGRNLALETETTDLFGNTKLIQGELSKMLKEIILPNTDYEIDQWWSGILGVGNTKEPIVKMYSDRIGVAVRLGGMGIAIGSLIGKEAAKMILEN